jgi:hypothetical protein
MPSKNNVAKITAFTEILATLTACGHKPTVNVTDNKCSKTVEAHIKFNKIDIRLVPPCNRCVNAAKCATATFKEHFIAGLATVNRNCPLQLWDKYFCTKSSSHSIFSAPHDMTPANLSTRWSTALVTSSKHQSQQSVLKASSTTTPLSVPAGNYTEN